MEFSAGLPVACAGGEHIEIPITVNGETRTLKTTRSEILAEIPDDPDEQRIAILRRLISRCKEQNATTPVQIRNAIDGFTGRV